MLVKAKPNGRKNFKDRVVFGDDAGPVKFHDGHDGRTKILARKNLGKDAETSPDAGGEDSSGGGSGSDAAKSGRNNNSLRTDPTRTATQRRVFGTEMKSRLELLRKDVKKAILQDDLFGIQERLSTSNDNYKIDQFREWIDYVASVRILGSTSDRQDNPWWDRYVKEIYRKGAAQSFDDVNTFDLISNQDQEDQDAGFFGKKWQFLAALFLSSRIVQKIAFLSKRVFSELKGVKDAIVQRTTRDLADGLVQGKTAKQIARSLDGSVEVGIKASRKVVETEITREFAEAQLDALEELKVERVVIKAEWKIKDERACPICKRNDGRVFTVGEARGLIPAHPFCRCRFVPVLVSETTGRRIRYL